MSDPPAPADPPAPPELSAPPAPAPPQLPAPPAPDPAEADPPASAGPDVVALAALTAQGAAVRRQVLGDAHVDRTAGTPFTAPFLDYVTRGAWAQVWSRPGLDRRTRSCITLAVLAAQGHQSELALHVEAALRHGVTPAEIQEILLHTAVYAGAPAANAAFATAHRVLTDLGALDD